MWNTISALSIEGFKSIKRLRDFELRPLNVLIGANGAGKSNFVGFFHFVHELMAERLQLEVGKSGGMQACLYLGPKVTSKLACRIRFGAYGYAFTLVPAAGGSLVFEFEDEQTMSSAHVKHDTDGNPLGSGHPETRIREAMARSSEAQDIHRTVSSWRVYHFDDTSELAPVRHPGPINHDEYLHRDAGNLAAFLFRVRQTAPAVYARVRDVVRLAAPFFDDFKLRPIPENPEMIKLEWLQRGTEYPLLASQLSDGTLRFICLATALLQPDFVFRPSMFFDEPELGLHPYALTLLASLFRQAAQPNGQVVVSTQSAQLLNEFDPEDVVVVERTQGQSVFRRLDSSQLSEWRDEYTLGDLWQKNVLGGHPRNESAPLPPDGRPASTVALQKADASAEDRRR